MHWASNSKSVRKASHLVSRNQRQAQGAANGTEQIVRPCPERKHRPCPTPGIGDTLPVCAHPTAIATAVNRLALLLALTLALSACGLKGPLYLPEPKAPEAAKAPANDDTKEKK